MLSLVCWLVKTYSQANEMHVEQIGMEFHYQSSW